MARPYDVVAAAIVVVFIGLDNVRGCQGPDVVTTAAGTLYDIKAYGQVLCARREVTPCGLRLSSCADTFVYECCQDVRYEDSQ